MLDSFHAMTLHAITEAIRKSDSVPDELVPQIHDVAQDLLTNLSDSNECSSLYGLIDKIRDIPEAEELSSCYEQEFELLIDIQSELQKGARQASSQSEPDYLKAVLVNCQFLKNYRSISNS